MPPQALNQVFSADISFFSHTEFAFRYDIDRDGYVIQEDVRLILSHVPIENSVNGHVAKEGAFTQMGGGR